MSLSHSIFFVVVTLIIAQNVKFQVLFLLRCKYFPLHRHSYCRFTLQIAMLFSVMSFSSAWMLCFFFFLYFAILPLNYSSHIFFYVGWDSVGCIATGYGLDGPEIESRKGRIFCPIHTGPGAHSASYKMSTGLFPGIKRPGRDVNHPHSTSAEAKERIDLYLYFFSVPSCQIIGWTLAFFFLSLSLLIGWQLSVWKCCNELKKLKLCLMCRIFCLPGCYPEN
jgi:hypothetical protein